LGRGEEYVPTETIPCRGKGYRRGRGGTTDAEKSGQAEKGDGPKGHTGREKQGKEGRGTLVSIGAEKLRLRWGEKHGGGIRKGKKTGGTPEGFFRTHGRKKGKTVFVQRGGEGGGYKEPERNQK